MREGSPLPEPARPPSSLSRIWEGFGALHGDRHVAFGAWGGAVYGAIPYLALAAWLRDNGYQPLTDEWARAEQLLRVLDGVYVRHCNERANEAAAEGGDGGRGSGDED